MPLSARLIVLFPALLTLISPLPAAGADPVRWQGVDREYDARPAYNRDFSPTSLPTQIAALDHLRNQFSGVDAQIDPDFGNLRTLHIRGGYLSGSNRGDAIDLARAFLTQQRDALGLTTSDIAGLVLKDRIPSPITGVNHLYFEQIHQGLVVYNARVQLHFNRDGHLLFLSSQAMPDAAGAAGPDRPTLSPSQAITAFAAHLGVQPSAPPEALTGHAELWRFLVVGLSDQPVEVRLQWLPIRQGVMRLVWNLRVRLSHGSNWFDANVDARDGRTWTRRDWVDAADYRAFPQPVESPIHSPAPPPADGRVIISDPEDSTASPMGWHQDAATSYTTTRGNNVRAVDDASSGNPSPDCGVSLECDFEFPIDFSSEDPRDYTDASVTNLFYWSNIIHDVMYHYGFDEIGGNFQDDNFSNGGIGGDAVDALGQSNNFRCPNNAFFGTPPDGGNGEMIMCLWTNSTPRRDFSWDSGVIVHEYAHGISNRLVGGPSNASCIGGAQRAGEGYSDWYSLVFTALPTHTGSTTRGSGTYILGQPIDGGGIRPQPYSTDPAVNSYTYESIQGLPQPHGVGSVWAQIAWEVYWALVERHGFDPDIYDAMGGSGNQRAIFYHTEALRMVPCDHTFADMRDAMLQVAADNFGGSDVCPMWEAFAGIGLGVDADPAHPGSVNVSNGFEVPAFCGVIFADGLEALP